MKFEKATEEELAAFGRRGAKRKWPYHDMDIGDVITVKCGEYGKTYPDLYAHQYAKKTGKTFRTQKVAQDTYRIVRIA